jgi:hypothetical protein
MRVRRRAPAEAPTRAASETLPANRAPSNTAHLLRSGRGEARRVTARRSRSTRAPIEAARRRGSSTRSAPGAFSRFRRGSGRRTTPPAARRELRRRHVHPCREPAQRRTAPPEGRRGRARAPRSRSARAERVLQPGALDAADAASIDELQRAAASSALAGERSTPAALAANSGAGPSIRVANPRDLVRRRRKADAGALGRRARASRKRINSPRARRQLRHRRARPCSEPVRHRAVPPEGRRGRSVCVRSKASLQKLAFRDTGAAGFDWASIRVWLNSVLTLCAPHWGQRSADDQAPHRGHAPWGSFGATALPVHRCCISPRLELSKGGPLASRLVLVTELETTAAAETFSGNSIRIGSRKVLPPGSNSTGV